MPGKSESDLHDLDIDLHEAFDRKMLKNESKYSVEKVKGSHKKYTEYET